MSGNYYSFDDFTVQHIYRGENAVVNDLAQQASGFRSNQGKLYFLEKLDVPISQTGWFDFRLMQGAEICYVESNSAKSNGPVL
jgi:hypothetical protein